MSLNIRKDYTYLFFVTGSLLGTVPLSGFTRRILLQVLLEDEKVTVALRALPELYCRFNPVGMSSRVGRRVHHPRFGAGRGCCSLTTNINSPCSEVLMRFGGEHDSICIGFFFLSNFISDYT